MFFQGFITLNIVFLLYFAPTFSATEFTLAAVSGDLQKMKKLIENGEDVDQTGPHGLTALMWASMANQIEIVDFLIGKKANLDLCETSYRRKTASLMFALKFGNFEIVEKLIFAGARYDPALLELKISRRKRLLFILQSIIKRVGQKESINFSIFKNFLSFTEKLPEAADFPVDILTMVTD
jgi:ankyrin repeat protein